MFKLQIFSRRFFRLFTPRRGRSCRRRRPPSSPRTCAGSSPPDGTALGYPGSTRRSRASSADRAGCRPCSGSERGAGGGGSYGRLPCGGGSRAPRRPPPEAGGGEDFARARTPPEATREAGGSGSAGGYSAGCRRATTETSSIRFRSRPSSESSCRSCAEGLPSSLGSCRASTGADSTETGSSSSSPVPLLLFGWYAAVVVRGGVRGELKGFFPAAVLCRVPLSRTNSHQVATARKTSR